MNTATPGDISTHPVAVSAFKVCDEHQRSLDDLARPYPPAIERSVLASGYLEAIAQEEVPLVEGSASRIRCPACAIGKARASNIEDSTAVAIEAEDVLVYAIRCSLPPSEVPVDAILERIAREEDARPGVAMIEWPPESPLRPFQFPNLGDGKGEERVILSLWLKDHRETPLPPLRFEAYLGGPARAGKNRRFVLKEIGPGVYKLAPSINVPAMVIAFVTIVEKRP
jgi:hypothetical protein